LGNVQARENLDARNQRLRQDVGGCGYAPQQAVDPHPYNEAGANGLDMDVSGAGLHRLFQKVVYSTNDRGAARKVAKALNIVVAALGRAFAEVRRGVLLVPKFVG